MIRLLRAALLLAIAAIAGTADAATLIANANGYSFEADGKLRRFAGLLVGNDGRVLALLPKGAAEPKLEPGDFRLDASGQTLIPGLIDSHMQLLRFGLAQRQLDLGGTTSPAEVRGLLRAEAGRLPADSWLLGRGWNEAAFGGTLPTAADLDAGPDSSLDSGRPVWLLRAGGFMGWANGAAMKAAGITKATADPPGGRISRDAAGNPDGLFLGTAMELIERHLPSPSAGERELALAAALRQLPALGITGVHDMGTTADDWQLFRAFADDGRLSVRITAYADGMAAMERISPLRPTLALYDDRLRLAGIRLVADGSLEGRGAWLLQPYADAPATSGVRHLDDAREKNLFSRANFLGYQLAVEASGDAAVRQALDSFADIRPGYGDAFRNRIEGAGVVDPADVPRFASLHILASLQPAGLDPAIRAERLGAERQATTSPWAEALAGGRFALGSGAPDHAPAPFAAIQAAAVTLSRAEALAGFTIGAAYAGHAEDRVGSLAAGHWADFLLLDRDPFQIAAEELPAVRVLETWLAGQRIHQQQ